MNKIVRRVISPFKSIVNPYIEKQVKYVLSERMRLTSINEFQEDDIFIVGYPKSGNTWFRFLTAGAIYGVDIEYAPSVLVYDMVPDIHYLPYYKRFHTPMFFKSHHLPQPQYKRVVYLVRDGRDVMVSYFHHLQALQGSQVGFSDLIHNNIQLGYGKWHDHVEAWLENPYQSQMIIIKYEDLLSQPVVELMRFCDFVGVQRTEALLQHVIQTTAFSELQKKETERSNFRESPMWPDNKSFFRRGKSGSYKDEMPQEILDEFLHQAGETLRKLGYLNKG
jgi:hypothetical protein